MIDDGATHNFLNYALVKKLKVPQTKSNHIANDQDNTIWDRVVKGVNQRMQEYVDSLDFEVMHSPRANVYLGKEWLYSLGPTLSGNYQDHSRVHA